MLILFTASLYAVANLVERFFRRNNLWLNLKNGLILLGLVFHAVVIFSQIITPEGLIFSLANSLIATSFFITILLLIASNIYKIYLLDLVVYPIVIVVLFVSFLLGNTSDNSPISFILSSHILLSLGAYSVLTLCFFQAILLSLQDKKLHHQSKHNLSALPPLETMENLLFSGLTLGVILLTLSLLSGFFFLEDVFAQHLLHKTVLSLIAWIIFSSILLTHLVWGLRGKKLTSLMKIAFSLLLVGYFGSKFVLTYLIAG